MKGSKFLLSDVLSKALLLVLFIIILTFITTFSFTLINNWYSLITFQYRSTSELLVVFSDSVKVFTALLAVLAITLTIERMKQTRESNELIAENNLFNNYNKHLELFIRHMNDLPIFSNEYFLQNYDKESYIKYLYKSCFFYDDFREFSTRLNSDSYNEMTRFFIRLAFHLRYNPRWIESFAYLKGGSDSNQKALEELNISVLDLRLDKLIIDMARGILTKNTFVGIEKNEKFIDYVTLMEALIKFKVKFEIFCKVDGFQGIGDRHMRIEVDRVIQEVRNNYIEIAKKYIN